MVSKQRSRTSSRRTRDDLADSIHALRDSERRIDVPAASRGAALQVHLAYPNTYWIGMSNLGFQAVYGLFAADRAVAVDRAFLPDDARQDQPFRERLRTFENNRLLGDCDVLGFSLSFETDYLHLLMMLNDAALLESRAEVRAEKADNSQFRYPIIIAGGTGVTLNPEPIAPFVDVVFIGEAEEFIPEFMATLHQARSEGVSRRQTLERLACIEGVYVPQFYPVTFNSDDTIASYQLEPHLVDRKIPKRPVRRFVKDLSRFPTHTKILTPQTEFQSMFLTETGRGCEMGCRFCVAGYIYRPVRKRSEDSIRASVQLGLKESKAIGFVGAAVSSHRAIGKLAAEVAEQGARASLSSLMAQKITPQLASSITESEYKTVALAPEAGTDRLRRAAGKRITNDQVVSAALELAQSGIRGFKLYFIVGLPTELDGDIDAIADLAIRVRDNVVEATRASGSVAWVQLSVNPFIPKASTPFQWEPMVEMKALGEKIDRIRERICKIPNLELRFESPKESYFQGLLSRGDRRVASLLEAAVRQKKDWKWILKAAAQGDIANVPRLDFYVSRRIPFDEILAWESVDSRIDPALLQRENRRAHMQRGDGSLSLVSQTSASDDVFVDEGDDEQQGVSDELARVALFG